MELNAFTHFLFVSTTTLGVREGGTKRLSTAASKNELNAQSLKKQSAMMTPVILTCDLETCHTNESGAVISFNTEAFFGPKLEGRYTIRLIINM